MKRFPIFAVLFIVVSMFVIAGCGGGGGAVIPAATNGQKIATKAIHQGANSSFYPMDVWGNPMSGRNFILYGTEESAKALSVDFLNGQYTHTENGFDWYIDTEWHVTSGLGLYATDTQTMGIYQYELKAQERIWDGSGWNILGDATQISLNINVVADDYTYPSTDPVNGGSINCGEGAILINDRISGWGYYGFYRLEADGSKTYLPVRIATTASATVILPDPDTGYTYNKPGNYVVEIGYGTSWSDTGDYKSRDLRIAFQMIGDQGTMGYMCRSYGQRVADREGLKFETVPMATSQTDKDRLNKKAMEDFFFNR